MVMTKTKPKTMLLREFGGENVSLEIFDSIIMYVGIVLNVWFEIFPKKFLELNTFIF